MRAIICVLLLAALGCDRDPALDRPLDPRNTLALRHHVAWAVPAQREMVLLRPTDLELTRVPLPELPEMVHAAPEGRGLLVLDPHGATWIPTTDPEAGEPVRFALGGDYRRASFGPLGERVVLYGEQGGGGASLRNPNQIAVLDLAGGTSTERTIRSYGSAPQAIVVAPAEDDRQLAWLLAERYLAVIDLATPAAREVVVHLVLRGDTREVTPAQVEFATVDGASTTFVRAFGSDDVFTLTFPEAAAPGEVPRPYLNQLPAARSPVDLRVQDTFEGPRVFTCGRGTLAITHPVTGRRTSVELGAPADRILPFRATRGDDLTGQEEGLFALLWAPGSRSVLFADLDLVERRGGRALTPLVLSADVTDVQPLPGRQGAVAQLGQAGLALLDFEARTATPLTASGSLTALVIEPNGERVHALVEAGPDTAVVTVDTATGAARSTSIPAGAGALRYVAGANRIVIDHRRAWGHVTVVDEDTITEHEGYLLQGALR